jgi:3-keto-disaccharide hydrolase
MRSLGFKGILLLALISVAAQMGLCASPGDADQYLGRWDITATGPKAGRHRFCWLELTRDGGTLKGRFNSGGGAVFDLPVVAIENGELRFEYPQGNTPKVTQQVWQATMKGARLVGTAQTVGGELTWTGVRGPVWPSNSPSRKPGKPIDLFNGKDVSGWLGQDPGRPLGWFVKDGILMNQGKVANNIYTHRKFRDFKLEVEFNVDPESNSGVYLRGRYEIQILDGHDRPLDIHSQGALYGFIVPPVNADKPAGEWQTYEITLIANRVTVILNGTKIIDNGEVPGITGGALDANESEPGPIMLQGDHGRVQFRKVRLTPLI